MIKSKNKASQDYGPSASKHTDSFSTVKKKSNSVSNKSTSYSRQRQLRGTGKNAPVVSNSKEVQPEKKGGRNSTEADAPSSQLGEMKWHDFQTAEKKAWNHDKKNIFLFIYSFNMVAIGMAIMSPNVVFDVALFLIALNAVCAYIQLNLMRSL